MIAADVILEEGVVIFHRDLVNLYGCRIGAGTKIGTFVEIQKNAVVGRRCKMSSHTFVCEGVTIEDEVFVGHGVMFINDRYPRATSGRAAADRGGLDGAADARASRGVDRQRRRGAVRRHHRRGRARGRGRRGHSRRAAGGDGCRRAGSRAGAARGRDAAHDRHRRHRIRLLGAEPGPQLRECRGAAVRAVCDREPERLQQVERRYPGVTVTTSASELVRRPLGGRRGDRHAGRTPLRPGDAGAARGQARAGGEADGVLERAGGAAHRRSGGAQARADGGPHLRLHRRRAQDARADRRPASSARSTTTIPCASTWASSSTTSTCCGIWPCTICRSWTTCWTSAPWPSRRPASLTWPGGRRTSRT